MSALRIRALVAKLGSPAAVLWALAVVLVVRPQTDPDYWWHLRVGDWILDNRAVPHVDLLSWLANGPWIAHEWGDEVIFAIMQRGLGSTAGSVILFGLVAVACLALVAACVRLLRPSLSATAVAGIVLVAALAASPVWAPRGQLWDTLFSLITLRVLLGYFDRAERSGLWALPPLMVVWVNLHGGGVDFIWAVFAAVLVGEWWNRRVEPAASRPSFRPVLLTLAATTAAMILNPYGPAIYAYPLSTVGSGAMANLIQEWNSPDFHGIGFRPAQVLLAFGLVAGLAAVRLRDGRALALVAGLTFLFLQSARYVGLWAPITMAVAGPALIDALNLVWDGPRRPILPRQLLRPPLALAGQLMAISLALAFLVTGAAVLPAAGARYLAQSEPVATADWLAAHPDTLAGQRLWNTYGWGGYLSWRLGVEVGPYGAADAFGDATLLELDALGRLTTDPGAFLDAHRVTVVVYQADRPLAFWLSANPSWRLLHRDVVAVVFARVAPLP